MNINRTVLKADAKAAMRESKTSPYLTAFIYSLILYVLGLLQMNLTSISVNFNAFTQALETGNFEYIYYLMREQEPGSMARLIDALLSLMTAMMGIGFTIFTLNTSRRLNNSVGNLFDGFGNFFRFLWLLILIWLFTFLWSLLLLIPGIIASYRYRLAVFILIDNPTMRPIDCIRKSKELMLGHKAELFVLDLSFLGWILLTLIPFVSIYVYPYTSTTYAGYYDALRQGEHGYYQRPSSGPSGPSGGPTGYAADKEDELPPWEFKD